MNAAEMKTIRESLGLTAQWVADQAGVKLRTAQYWEAGRGAIPADVVDLINEAQSFMDTNFKQGLKELKGKQKPLLTRYRDNEELWKACPRFNDTRPYPVTFHSMLLARIRNEIINQKPTIIYFNQEDKNHQ